MQIPDENFYSCLSLKDTDSFLDTKLSTTLICLLFLKIFYLASISRLRLTTTDKKFKPIQRFLGM